MSELVIPDERPSLAGFADYLANQQTVITDQWLLTVRRDTQIETADRIPTSELVDHLPRLLQELCLFLRTRDVDDLTGDARRDAAEHGVLRWRDGYKIDELVRELEAFRRLVAAAVFRYRDVNTAFNGLLEVSASALVQQFFAEITIASVKRFMDEQQQFTRSNLQNLAQIQEQLGRVTAELGQARDAQHRATTVVANELRVFLESQRQPKEATQATSRLAAFVEQLLEYAELSGIQQPPGESFDPRVLFSEIVAECKPIAEAKGLRLLTDCLRAPTTVVGNRARIKKIAQLLLRNAIEYTPKGQVSLAFSSPDAERWAIQVGDTGPGLSEADSAQLFNSDPIATDGSADRGLGLAMARELAKSVGASFNSITQAGLGTHLEVSIPKTQAC
jgi:signal transduction histidine kinase